MSGIRITKNGSQVFLAEGVSFVRVLTREGAWHIQGAQRWPVWLEQRNWGAETLDEPREGGWLIQNLHRMWGECGGIDSIINEQMIIGRNDLLFSWSKPLEYVEDGPFVEFPAMMDYVLREFQGAVRSSIILRICSHRTQSIYEKFKSRDFGPRLYR